MESSTFFISIVYTLIVFSSFGTICLALPISWIDIKNESDIPRIVSRREWGARPPVAQEPMHVIPTPYVVVHHGGIRKYCHNQKECSTIVRQYQDMHIDERGWYDIGYSFVIGEDGNIYEGRGWDYVGAHAPGFNQQSIGICIIGDFSDFLPNTAALKALNNLINYGVSIGKIASENYSVIGHRQARNTLCPGDELYKYVQTYPRWTSTPKPRNMTATSITATTKPIAVMDNNIADTNKDN